nr:hypothetical protein [Tanacetum cinerariifolium]
MEENRRKRRKTLENDRKLKDGVVPSATVLSGINNGDSSHKGLNFRILITHAGNGADVDVLLESIRVFSSMDGLDSMLENGLWFICNNLLILQEWNLDVNLMKEDVVNVLVWAKLYGVLVTKFNKDGLSVIFTKLDTPLILDSYTSYMCIQSWGRSSYARALIEIRADVELKDTTMVAMPKHVREGFYMSTIHVDYDSTSTTPIVEKIDKIERLIIDGKVTLVDDEGKPLEKVDSSSDHDSEDEVESVDNNTISFLALKKEIPDKIQYICDNLDIKVRGQPVPSSCTGRSHYRDGTAKNQATVLADFVPLNWPVPL